MVKRDPYIWIDPWVLFDEIERIRAPQSYVHNEPFCSVLGRIYYGRSVNARKQTAYRYWR